MLEDSPLKRLLLPKKLTITVKKKNSNESRPSKFNTYSPYSVLPRPVNPQTETSTLLPRERRIERQIKKKYLQCPLYVVASVKSTKISNTNPIVIDDDEFQF